MKKLAALLCVLAACSAGAFGEAVDRSNVDAVPPGPSAPRPLRLPRVTKATLPNGLEIETVEDHRIPLVTLRLYVPDAGSLADPRGQEGTAEAAAATMTDGVPGMTSAAIADAVAGMGGSLRASASRDGALVAGDVLSSRFTDYFSLFARVALNPTFPEQEIGIYRTNALQKLELARSDPEFLAGVRRAALLYGDNPYGRVSATPESLRSLTRERVSAFYATHFSPHGALLVVYGDVEQKEAASLARKEFGAWSTPAPAPVGMPAPPARQQRVLALVERPGSVQATLDFGSFAPRATDAGYFDMLVANRILGGGTASRLFLDIREKRGYTYDPYSSYDVNARYGTFEAGCNARNDVAAAAFGGFLENFDGMVAHPPGDKELEAAKTYLNGTFALRFVTQGGVAAQLVALAERGLAFSWLESYRDRVGRVTAEEVRSAARRYIDTPDSVAVVVGDPSLAPALSRYGTVARYDIDGKEIPAPQGKK